MTSGDTRRAFVSSLLLAGGSVAAFGKSFQAEGPAGEGPSGDILFEHIQQQLGSLIRGAKSRGGFLSAEDAAMSAAFMRVGGVHARGRQLDEEAHRALNRRMTAVGRNGLINLPPDLGDLRSSMRRKGLIIGERLFADVSRSDGATRAAALAAVQGGQASRVFDRLAEAFEAAAPRIANTGRPVRRVAAADEAWCSFLVSQWTMYLTIAWYIASFDDSTLQAFAEAMWAGFVTYDLLYQQQC